mmetsp:Transcript_27889/g.82676  ORF Transcript_27889/g.82676 Transcript_27889/m.82676 type:complete len:258 (-) Transcript_27889:1209-1982(-)
MSEREEFISISRSLQVTDLAIDAFESLLGRPAASLQGRRGGRGSITSACGSCDASGVCAPVLPSLFCCAGGSRCHHESLKRPCCALRADGRRACGAHRHHRARGGCQAPLRAATIPAAWPWQLCGRCGGPLRPSCVPQPRGRGQRGKSCHGSRLSSSRPNSSRLSSSHPSSPPMSCSRQGRSHSLGCRADSTDRMARTGPGMALGLAKATAMALAAAKATAVAMAAVKAKATAPAMAAAKAQAMASASVKAMASVKA